MPVTLRAYRSVALAVGLATVLGVSACADRTSTALTSRQKSVVSTDSDVAMRSCGDQCAGELDGAKYSIKLPEHWNGTLLL